MNRKNLLLYKRNQANQNNDDSLRDLVPKEFKNTIIGALFAIPAFGVLLPTALEFLGNLPGLHGPNGLRFFASAYFMLPVVFICIQLFGYSMLSAFLMCLVTVAIDWLWIALVAYDLCPTNGNLIWFDKLFLYMLFVILAMAGVEKLLRTVTLHFNRQFVKSENGLLPIIAKNDVDIVRISLTYSTVIMLMLLGCPYSLVWYLPILVSVVLAFVAFIWMSKVNRVMLLETWPILVLILFAAIPFLVSDCAYPVKQPNEFTNAFAYRDSVAQQDSLLETFHARFDSLVASVVTTRLLRADSDEIKKSSLDWWMDTTKHEYAIDEKKIKNATVANLAAVQYFEIRHHQFYLKAQRAFESIVNVVRLRGIVIYLIMIILLATLAWTVEGRETENDKEKIHFQSQQRKILHFSLVILVAMLVPLFKPINKEEINVEKPTGGFNLSNWSLISYFQESLNNQGPMHKDIGREPGSKNEVNNEIQQLINIVDKLKDKTIINLNDKVSQQWIDTTIVQISKFEKLAPLDTDTLKKIVNNAVQERFSEYYRLSPRNKKTK